MHELTTLSVEDDDPSRFVPQAIADITNTPVDELEPIGRTVDLDAIDRLLTHSETASVTFECDDLQVQVDSEAVVVLKLNDVTGDR